MTSRPRHRAQPHHRGPSRVAGALGALALAGAAWAQPARQPAQPPDAPPGEAPQIRGLPTQVPPALDRAGFERLVADLDSPDLTTRELASERLGVLPGLELHDVLGRLASGGLSPEQARRLERVAARLFQNAPKAGLGVQFGRQNAAKGVEIAATVDPERFPAALILRAGDFIAEVHGRPVRSPDDLRAMILAHLPGELMPAVVVRGEERLSLDLPLGNFEQLGQAARIDDETARRCVRERLERLGAPGEPEAIGAETTAHDWAEAGDALGARGPRRARPTPGVGVTVGGSPRVDPTGAQAGTALTELIERVEPGAFDPEAMTPEQRLEWYMALQQSRVGLQRQINTTRTLLGDPSNTAAEAERLEERIRELVVEQRRVDDQMTVLRELGLD